VNYQTNAELPFRGWGHQKTTIKHETISLFFSDPGLRLDAESSNG
jgi:hypothetical protein